jgi:hypothetical protein
MKRKENDAKENRIGCMYPEEAEVKRNNMRSDASS